MCFPAAKLHSFAPWKRVQFVFGQFDPLGHLGALRYTTSPRPYALASAVAVRGSTAFARDRLLGLKKLGSSSSIILAQLRSIPIY